MRECSRLGGVHNRGTSEQFLRGGSCSVWAGKGLMEQQGLERLVYLEEEKKKEAGCLSLPGSEFIRYRGWPS